VHSITADFQEQSEFLYLSILSRNFRLQYALYKCITSVHDVTVSSTNCRYA